MTNLVFNLRNAKAQAGCAKSTNRTYSSLPFREGAGLGFLGRGFILLLLITLGVGQMWAASIFNCGIDVNDTWYKGTGTINSGNWLGDKTAFNSANLGTLTEMVLGGQYDTWDNNQTDQCSWNSKNGIWITIKKGNTQKANFKLTCYHDSKDGNNNVWKTKGGTGSCSDSGSWGTYTYDISSYTPGDDYTIKASWTSPSSQSTNATASFTIPGFTSLSTTSVTFDNTTVGNTNDKSITYTHYGTAPTNVAARYSITGTNANQFSITALSGTGATIRFSPTSAGSKTATLVINDVHGKTTSSITLSGTALAPSVPTIVLTSVSPSTSIVAGNDITLVGTRSNSSNTISFQYTTNDGSTWTDITPKTSSGTSTKTITWTVPDAHGATQTFKFRAKLAESTPIYSAKSDGVTVYNTRTIHVRNTNGWASMYLYLYSDSGEKEAWHGSTTGISSYGGQWKTVVLTSQWPYFILNDNGSNQIKGDKTYKYADMTDGNCYAISSGTGNALTLSSATCPTAPTSVTTTATPTSITNTGMTISGNIGGNGNDNITDYGFYYGTSSTPGTKAQVGTTNKTGAISKALTGLTAGTTYYFRAYATNGQGTTYGTTYSYKIPYSVTITKSTGCESITPAAGSYYYNAGFTVTAVAATGYTFSAWTKTNGTTSGASSPSTGTNTVTFTPTANSATITATYTANTYTISFSNSGTGYGSGGQTATKTATYNAAMPAVTAPTASMGYKFMGYFDAAGGEGTQYYTATGASAHVWDKTSNATLYAYYAPATITSVTLNHEAFEYESAASGDADKDYVSMTANPTITPSGYVTPINVTWELQYSNGNPVVGHDPIYEATYRAKFSIVGLARGTYQLHATVRTGSTRGSGTVVSTYDKPFQIASDYDITVNYKCDTGDGLIVIKAPTSVKGYALEATEITAPEITGYAFSKWRAGDGVTITGADSNGEKASATISFTATFDGSLTAIYTRKNLIYFNNTLGWSDVYVYFYSNNKYWDDSYGTGAYKGKYFDGTYPYTDMRHGHMTQIEGTNIWYFDYTAAGYPTLANVAFADMDKSNSGTDNTSDNSKAFFCNTTAQPMKVARRGDHSASLPMFVPLSGQTGVLRNGNKARYYDSGYWMNYPENTGYWLKIWDGSLELYNKPFEFTPDKTMPMSIDVNLDAEHTYEFKIYRIDNNWYGYNGTMKNGSSGDVGQTVWEFQTGKDNCKIITSAAGNYTFTLNYGYKSSAPVGYHYLVGVHYPAAVNDFQVLYNDRATWSLGYAHSATWIHPSRMIEARAGGVDTISFFVAKDNTPILKARRVGSIAPNTGIISWSTLTINGNASQSISVSESGVYNFKVTQGAKGVIASIENIGAYTGNYYIRCQALANGWGNYRDETDHLMTYTEFSENRSTNTFGELYSHYKAKWCERNMNIKFCIANDYSPCITDTLIQDVPNSFTNTESDGTLKYEKNGDNSMMYNNSGNAYLDKYSANVRFMWNRTTNKISRAYVAAATSNEAQFLMLQGSGTTNANIYSSLGNPLTNNAIRLQDDQNWIYETTIQANPSALIKLYATYNNVRQYFCGTSDATFVNGTTALELLGGSASSTKYSVRVIYDFKTNRLVCAWIPTGHTQDISGNVILNSDVMFVREHQEEAQCITFSNPPADKLSSVKTVYGSMKFNRWILGNRANPTDTDPDHCDTDEHLSANHPPLGIGSQLSPYERALYFISFPFNVKLSEVFGFGQYGVHWVIEYYDGLNRAKNGYWIDSDPNWKFVDPDMAQTYELKKGEGYILCLNLSRMAYNDREFWSNNISETELFFPSKSSTVGDITATDVTIDALPDTYRCTINRPGEDGDRRIKDSYWRCIGVPGYSTYNGSLTTNGSAITWKNDDSGEFDISKFPFLYAWNTADNSLTAQATTNYRFKATHAYLVQNGNQIVWSKGNFRNSIVARRQKAEDIINTDWRLTISRNDQMEDQAFVRMSDNEDVTEEFDFGQDLVKELNSGRSNIYSYIGYEKCAANSMPINTTTTTVVPLGVKTDTDGDYTIALPDGASGVNINLVDAETGDRTNLSAGLDYTVTLPAGDYNDRFSLEIAPIQHIPTGIEDVQGDNAQNAAHKVLLNGVLYIVRGDQMFDARGARVE